jgi:hypothetical protein
LGFLWSAGHVKHKERHSKYQICDNFYFDFKIYFVYSLAESNLPKKVKERKLFIVTFSTTKQSSMVLKGSIQWEKFENSVFIFILPEK